MVPLRWLAILTALFSAHTVQGQAAGSMQYNTTSNEYEFYDGSSWTSMDNGDTTVICSEAGEMRYDTSNHRLEFCNGSTWRTMMGLDTTNSCSKQGAFYYNSTNSDFEICNGNTNTWWQSQSTIGYFVLSSAFHNGNLGGLTGADSTCLSDLTTNDWLGKSSAGTLTAARVKAFLCDSSTCNNLNANTTYNFAIANSATSGGASLTTDSSGLGPNDSGDWDGTTYFGDNAWSGHWTGRASTSSTQWSNSPGTDTCVDWSNSTGGQDGVRGIKSTTATRWSNGLTSCNSSYHLICIVHP